jgi:hypothetical protein
MAQQPSKGQEKENDKSFARFLSEQPHASDARTVSLSGIVLRSDKEGMFVLNTGDDQNVEVSVEAVKGYQVLSEMRGQRLVQLELIANRLPDQLRITLPAIDTFKEAPVDTIKEPIGDQTLKEAPWDTLKESVKDPIQDTFKEGPWDTFKESGKDPIQDTFKELGKDPIQDTLKEQIGDPNTWVEGIGGTLQEGINQPGLGNVVNPASGAMPFVMATPHHASTAPQMMQLQMQALGRGGATAKAPALDGTLATLPQIDQTLKEGPWDTLKEQIGDPTFKESIHDTLKETIQDTIKELIGDPNTWVEGIGGTMQEGIGRPGDWNVNPPVWGFPGLML